MHPPQESTPTASPGSAGTTASSVTVRCWGTRGSIPSPGPATAVYGGNTPCLEITVAGHRMIFDAGTGIRPLGTKLVEEDGVPSAHIFLTHFHWDHIQGFPFFAPLYDPRSHLRIFGPKQANVDIETLFAGQMGPIYFPIPFSAVAAEMSFHHMNEAEWEEEGMRVTSMRVRHPSFAVGYRLEAGGRSICYVPDNELVGGDYPVREGWREHLISFLGDADVLFHDAMFTEEEYADREGWGHSTYGQTLDLAREAGVKKLYFFHHAPERSDAELDRILDRLRNETVIGDLEVKAAFEGKQIST